MSQEISVILSLQTAQALAKLNSFLGGATHGLKEFAAEVVGAYVGLEGLRKIEDVISDAINLEVAIGRLNERTGLSIPLIAALKDEADLVSVPFEEASTSFSQFSRRIFDAATNGGKSAEAFERLKVNLLGTDGALRATDDILAEVSQAFKEMPSGPMKTAMAVDLFGRAGAQLIPILNKGAEGIKEMRDAGSPITPEAVTEATTFKTTMREFHQIVEDVTITLANKLLPTLIQLADKLKNSAKDASENKEVLDALVGTFKGFVTIALAAGFVVYEFGAALGYAAENDVESFNTAVRTIRDVLGELKLFITDTIRLLDDLVGAALASKQAVGLAMSGQFKESAAVAKAAFDEIRKDIHNVGADVYNAFADTMAGVDEVTKRNSETQHTFIEKIKDDYKKLADFLKGLWASTTPPAAKPGATTAAGSGVIGPSADALKNLARWAEIQHQIYENSLKMIESDPFKSQLEKAHEILPLIQAQKEVVAKSLEDATAQYNAATTEDKRLEAKREMVRLQGELNELQNSETKFASLDSFSGQFKMVLAELQDSWGSWASQTATAFKNTFQTAVSSISSGITGLIMGTKSWGQALREIGTNILTMVIQSIIQMGVQFVMTHLIMKGALIAFHAIADALGWSSASQVVAQETMKAPILATNAATSSVSSYGAAAVVGIAALVAALGIGIAAATGAFREHGGPVTAGMPYIVGEKRPELFVPTQNGYILPSVPAIEALSSGATGSQGGSGSPNLNFAIHNWNEEAAMIKLIRDHPEINHIILDKVRKSGHVIGARA